MSKTPLAVGECGKRKLEVEENRLCDWFDPKRKTRYRVCCRNCKFFELTKKATENPKSQ